MIVKDDKGNAVEQTSYWPQHLEKNNVIHTSSSFITKLGLESHQTRIIAELNTTLSKCLDRSVPVLPEDFPSLADDKKVTRQKNGHQDMESVIMGYRLSQLAQELRDESEAHWDVFWVANIWQPLGLISSCKYTLVTNVSLYAPLTTPERITRGDLTILQSNRSSEQEPNLSFQGLICPSVSNLRQTPT